MDRVERFVRVRRPAYPFHHLTGDGLWEVRTAEAALGPRRDRAFREQVMVAYEYRCAFCGYDGRLRNAAVGLDAAHVQWWAFDGIADARIAWHAREVFHAPARAAA